MRKLSTGLVAGGIMWLASLPGIAADLYSLEIRLGDPDTGELRTFNNTNVIDLIDNLDRDNLQASFGSGYTGQEQIFATLNFRGVPVTLDFPTTGETLLAFGIGGQRPPGTVCESRETTNATFCGVDRDDSFDLFVDFLKSSGGDVISELYKRLAKDSPVDPIAGNPTSTQYTVARRDFQEGFTHRVSQVWGCSTGAANEQIMLAKAGFGCQQEVAALPAVEVADAGGVGGGLYDDYYDRVNKLRGDNKKTIGLQYARVSTSDADNPDYSSSVFTLPLGYTIVFDSNPRRKLTLHYPVTVVITEGATALQLGLGLGYVHPITPNWTLTPSVGATAVGSPELATGAALISYSVTSSYSFDIAGWGINIGNMIGNYSTQKIKFGDYESDPGISNTVLTNGLLVSGPNSLLANNLVMEYFVNDSRFSGDDLYTDNYQEAGVNIGRIKTQGEIVTSYLKGGISYLVGSGDNDRDVSALRLSITYKY